MIYLDNAATTFPKPPEVVNETARCIREYCGNPGRGSHRLALAASEALLDARERLTALVGGSSPELCVFTLNTTYALNIALKSVVKSGSHILISDIEHNSVLRQVKKLKERKIADYDVFKTSGDVKSITEDIKKKICHKTDILVCLHSSNICGRVLPLIEIGNICKTHGIKFIADAAQSAGHLDLDLKKMNAYAICLPSHKGLYGPQGAGAVIFKDESAAENATFAEGGSGSDSLLPDMPFVLPDRYEAGTMPTPAVAGLAPGIDFVMRQGAGNIHRHESALARLLSDELRSDNRFTVYEPDRCGGIVLFNIRNIPSSDVAYALDRADIYVRAGFHCAPLAHKSLGTGASGAVRVSFGAFNETSDVRALLDALCRIK